jgi:hypothetical protein
MYPHERSLVTKYEGKPFAIVGINSDRDREKIKQICKEKKLTWRSFWNGGSTGGPISTRWNVSGWPTIYLIDHKGIIRAKGHGLDDELLEKLVAEAMSP